MPVDERWCLIHATHITQAETVNMARSGAVAGLCPITETNLGDGVFNASAFLDHKGLYGIGPDSNIRISVSEEQQQLEYSVRLKNHIRNVIAAPSSSNGRVLFEQATVRHLAAFMILLLARLRIYYAQSSWTGLD